MARSRGGTAPSSKPRRTGVLKNNAYRLLKERIIAGELAGGDFLTERELAESLGMSKTPIRFALERLELEGFVRVSPQRGIVVREPAVGEIADQFEIRMALESFAVRQMAGNLSEEQIEQVEANLHKQKEAADAGDVSGAVELDTEFHMLFCNFLGNGEICRVMSHLRDRISVVIRRVFSESDPTRLFDSHDEHRGIARAAISGKADLAVKRLEKHFEYGKQSLLAPRRGGG